MGKVIELVGGVTSSHCHRKPALAAWIENESPTKGEGERREGKRRW